MLYWQECTFYFVSFRTFRTSQNKTPLRPLYYKIQNSFDSVMKWVFLLFRFSSKTNGRECHLCDSRKTEHAHPAHFLTDLHNPNNVTCWQSDVMNAGQNISLTISLKKKYELTYISLHFCHAKPHSMAIFKSMDHGRTWEPLQVSIRCSCLFLLAFSLALKQNYILSTFETHEEQSSVCNHR